MQKARKILLTLAMSALPALVSAGGCLAGSLPQDNVAVQSPPPSGAVAGVPGVMMSNPGPGDSVSDDSAGEEDAMPPADVAAPACDFASWTGKPVDEAAVKATGRPYRILKPNDMATRDYSAERINVNTDETGATVLSVTCG